MDISQPELEQLRARVREAVIAVLRKREAQAASGKPVALGGKSVIILFTGHQFPSDDFFANAATIASQGYQLVAASGHTFTQFHASQLGAKLPRASTFLPPNDELALRDAVRAAEVVIAPSISSNTAAKVATGIEDSLPSRLLRAALLSGKPICVSVDLPAHRQMFQESSPAASPVLTRITDDHLHTLQQMGLRFVGGNVAACITEILRPFVNETPERLSRQKPSSKREFVTVEDVWNALSRGQKEMMLSPGTIVTDEARTYAASRGITLRER